MKKIFNRQSVIWMWLVLAGVGIADTSYLTYSFFQHSIIPCAFTSGCQAVTQSRFSQIGGVPMAGIGLFYYLTLFALVLLIALHPARRRQFSLAILALSGLGFLASLGFVYIQAFILHQFCTYCLLSAFDTTLIFGLSLWYLLAKKQD